jgi:hypothetical protein
MAPHTNSFGLGDTGRYRTNVWDYAGVSSISAHRQDDLAMHPHWSRTPFGTAPSVARLCWIVSVGLARP